MKKAICILFSMLMAFSVLGMTASAVATPLEAGSSMASAAQIPNFGVDYVSSLDVAGEEDWFKFTTLSEDAYYFVDSKNYNISNKDVIGTSSNVALHVHLYDVNRQELATSWGDATNSFSMNKKLETNTVYYLKAYHANRATGNYQIRINYQLDLTPNDMKNASLISINQKIIQSLDGPGDVDWYCFTAAAMGEYVVSSKNYNISNKGVIGTSSNVALHVHLYDQYNQELRTSWGDANNSFSLKANLEKGQKYYIKVYHANSATGNYEFSVTTDALTPAKTLQSISVLNLPNKTTYEYGESLNTAGLVVRARYSDNSTTDVTDYSVKDFNATLPGTQTLTVSYTENGVTKTTTFTVTVKPAATQNTLQSIYVVFLPDKTTYEIGEALDTKGMVIHGDYSDGTSAQITDYSVSGFDSTNAGEKVVTVTARVNGVTRSCTFTVTVNEKEEQKPDAASTWQKIVNVIKLIWSPLVKIISALLKLFKALSGALA